MRLFKYKNWLIKVRRKSQTLQREFNAYVPLNLLQKFLIIFTKLHVWKYSAVMKFWKSEQLHSELLIPLTQIYVADSGTASFCRSRNRVECRVIFTVHRSIVVVFFAIIPF
jgi:hypothetical protein